MMIDDLSTSFIRSNWRAGILARSVTSSWTAWLESELNIRSRIGFATRPC